MNVFRFRGERVLEWRRVQADAARGEFVRATESVREAAALVAEAEMCTSRAGQEYLEALSRPADVGTVERYRNWIGKQQGQLNASRRLLVERQAVADSAANVLHVATRNVRAMERLRDRALRRHTEAERLVEMKDLDQLATLQYARKRREGGVDREY